jgi:excisionase family DNA binding protein
MSRKPSAEPRPAPIVWLSLEQAADTVGVQRTTLRRWALDGDPRLPAYQVWGDGNHSPVEFRYKKSDVEAYQERLAGQPAEAQEA